MNLTTVITALSLTLLAGLSTGIGGLLSMFQKRSSSRFLCTSLGFSAGVMVYISFMDILPESIKFLQGSYSDQKAGAIAIISFFVGVLIIGLIDRFVPSRDNPHEIPNVLAMVDHSVDSLVDHHLMRTGIFSAIAITIHNIPEGLAVGVLFGAASTLVGVEQTEMIIAAISLAIGIGIQNFPEGFAVAMPLRRQGVSRFKSFWYGQLSAIVEPVAAVLGALAVSFFTPILPYALAFAAGAMIFVVVEEVIPETQRDKYTDIATLGFIGGFIVMMSLDVGLG